MNRGSFLSVYPFFILFFLFPFYNSAQIVFSFSDSAVERRIRTDIGILASDSFHGREAGTGGEKLAFEYITECFRDAGLSPEGNEDSSYLQKFQYTFNGFSRKNRFIFGNREIRYRQQFSVISLSGNGHARGLVADAGDGLVIEEKGLDDYQRLEDVSGKFVLIDLDIPGELYRDTSLLRKLTPRYRMEQALSHGAVGVIFCNPDSPYQSGIFSFEITDTLHGLAIYVTSDIARKLKRFPLDTAEITVKIIRKQVTYTNVIGFIDNGAPYTIIIGAHYDHLGMSRDSLPENGADDNASGTAGMIELARYFAQGREKQSNYLFAAFSAEEKGLLGSKYFCQAPPVSLKTVNFMVNFDMIGRLGYMNNKVNAEAVNSSPVWRKLYHEIPHEAFGLKLVKGSLPFSDHYYFYTHHIPVLYLNTGLHPQYHTPADDPQLINYHGMAGIIRYSKELIIAAEKKGKIPWKNVSSADNFFTYVSFALEFLGIYIGY